MSNYASKCARKIYFEKTCRKIDDKKMFIICRWLRGKKVHLKTKYSVHSVKFQFCAQVCVCQDGGEGEGLCKYVLVCVYTRTCMQ